MGTAPSAQQGLGKYGHRGLGCGWGAVLQRERFLLPTKQDFPSPSVLHGPFIYGFLILLPAPWWSFPVLQALGQKGMLIVFIHWWGHD